MNFYDYKELDNPKPQKQEPKKIKVKTPELTPLEQVDNLLASGEKDTVVFKSDASEYNKLYVRYRKERAAHKVALAWNQDAQEITIYVK
jgi:hypothetical protein